MSSTPVNVGIAEIMVSRVPQQLRTVLGSCVAICLYDKKKKIAGLAHIMLPEQKSSEANPNKYADSALPILIKEMEAAGSSSININAKIVGGAEVLKFSKFSSFSKIGKTNVDKLREILAKSGIPLVGEDTGGECGRNIVFDPANGSIQISLLNGEHRSI